MSKNNFLCPACLSVMCSDCKEIASEYDELLRMRNQGLLDRDRQIEELERKLKSETALREDFEKWLKKGLPAIMLEWIDSQVGKRKDAEGEGSEDRLYKTARAMLDYYDEAGPKKFVSRFGSVEILEVCQKIITEGEGNPHPWE